MAEMSQTMFVTLSERVTLWLARAGSVGLAVMMFLTLFDVIGRAFDHPISGSVEVTELIMGIMIYLGVGYTTFLRGHIRVDILIINFRPRIQAILDVITGLVGLFITILISWQLFIQAHSRMINNETTQIWEVSLMAVGFYYGICQHTDGELTGITPYYQCTRSLWPSGRVNLCCNLSG